jgi:hypothetical protein
VCRVGTPAGFPVGALGGKPEREETEMDNDISIARTILCQIETGVKMACGMHEFVALPNGLKAKVSHRYYLLITLNANDLYDVTVGSIRKFKWTVKSENNDVHFEDLNRLLLEVADIA